MRPSVLRIRQQLLDLLDQVGEISETVKAGGPVLVLQGISTTALRRVEAGHSWSLVAKGSQCQSVLRNVLRQQKR